MSAPNQPRILMVDDEPNILAGYRRTVGRIFDLTVAEGGAKALKALTGPEFTVIIADMRMPNMDGLQFINAARAIAKTSVFMMLTGNADQQTAINAINTGRIFRFINKPCTPELLESSIRDAIQQHGIQNAERILMRDTLAGAIRVLSETIQMSNPTVFAFQSMTKQIFRDLLTELKVEQGWTLYVAASLCLIGLIAVPDITSKDVMSDASLEFAAIAGAGLVRHIPRLQPVADMILHQRDFGMLPADLTSALPEAAELIGPSLLRYSVDLARAHHRLGSRAAAIKSLYGEHDKRLSEAAAKIEMKVPEVLRTAVVDMAVSEIKPGMIIESGVFKPDGAVLFQKGGLITEITLASLEAHSRKGLAPKRISVRVDVSSLQRSAA